MKATFFAAAAAMAGAASAANHRHAHQQFAKRGHAASTGFPVATTAEICIPGCTTVWKTIVGEPTLVPITVKTVTSTATNTSTVTVTPTPTSVISTVVVVPTPEVQKCPTPGTYTFPATTLTVTDTTTVCGATTTKVPSGTHTVGGVTTIVTTQTTVTCPYATIETTGGVTTSTIRMTEYVCPSAGTYTIGAHTTACETDTVIVYPTPTTIAPGTYTKPQVVVTATETDYVTVCPFTKSGLPTSTATPAASTPAPAPASTQTSTPAPSTGSGSSKSVIVGKTENYGLTYGPYDSNTGACKSADQVASDIAKIKQAGFEAVRIYGTDCDTLKTVVPACVKQGLEVIAGVFVKPGSECSINNPDVKKQIDDLNAMGNWDVVRLLVTGNESIFNGVCTPAALAQLIQDVKSSCPGYKGPVTIAETLNVWQRQDVSSTLCPLVDICGANIHAFFNPEVTASQAGQFVQNQITILEGICNKAVINLETGWKNAGNCNGDACPGQKEQDEAISSIRKTCGKQSVFFSFDNQQWKGADDATWGLEQAFNSLFSA